MKTNFEQKGKWVLVDDWDDEGKISFRATYKNEEYL